MYWKSASSSRLCRYRLIHPRRCSISTCEGGDLPDHHLGFAIRTLRSRRLGSLRRRLSRGPAIVFSSFEVLPGTHSSAFRISNTATRLLHPSHFAHLDHFWRLAQCRPEGESEAGSVIVQLSLMNNRTLVPVNEFHRSFDGIGGVPLTMSRTAEWPPRQEVPEGF
jgi:hypothetical protein